MDSIVSVSGAIAIVRDQCSHWLTIIALGTQFSQSLRSRTPGTGTARNLVHLVCTHNGSLSRNAREGFLLEPIRQSRLVSYSQTSKAMDLKRFELLTYSLQRRCTTIVLQALKHMRAYFIFAGAKYDNISRPDDL